MSEGNQGSSKTCFSLCSISETTVYGWNGAKLGTSKDYILILFISSIMKIALCFWGLLRSLPITIVSINEHIFKPLREKSVDFDVYVHTYHFIPENNPKEAVTIRSSTHDYDLLNPYSYTVEDQDTFDNLTNFDIYGTMGDPWHDNFLSLKNSIRALNSLYNVSQAVVRSGINYDFVVFLRPDVTYLNNIEIDFMYQYPDALLIPDFHRSCFGGEYNDRMAMGNMTTALIYGTRLERALSYSRRHVLHSETFVYDLLTEMHIPVIEIPFRFQRIRANGLPKERDKLIIAPSTQRKTKKKKSLLLVRVLFKRDIDDPTQIYCAPHTKIDVDSGRLFVKNLSDFARTSSSHRRKQYEREMSIYFHILLFFFVLIGAPDDLIRLDGKRVGNRSS